MFSPKDNAFKEIFSTVVKISVAVGVVYAAVQVGKQYGGAIAGVGMTYYILRNHVTINGEQVVGG